jgi:lysosomal alpha-mannosidase
MKLLFFILSLVLFVLGSKTKVRIHEEPKSTNKLNVHVIAHTHDDVGWLKTVDEYYYGANQSIQNAGVQYIIDEVIQALQENPDRRFIYVEIAFFSRWWNEQNEYKKNIVRDLVSSGRFEFINGGWCMNDEANTEYEAIIDQMTQGHLWLFREFGVRPRIGWHIDPFGHANTQASLFAQMGFDAFFFGRIDYQDHDIRNQTQRLEFVWRGSESLGEEIDIFSHVLYTDYCYLHGFAWEYGDIPIQDDPRLFDLNVKERADLFASLVLSRSASYKTNNILVPFGCDFQFQNALMNFKNMDKLMKYINDRSDIYNMTLFYSTPSMYIDSVHNAGVSWELNKYDFFPYADGIDAYWSGYFTSRPSVKGYVRSSGAVLHATDKLFSSALGVLSNLNTSSGLKKIDILSEAFSVTQHHDAVAGTEKQHVADDYCKRLYIGNSACEDVISETIGKLVATNSDIPKFSLCPLINESVCTPTDSLAKGMDVPVVIYNPIAWKRVSHIRIPIPVSNIQVLDSDGDIIPVQVLPNTDTGEYTLVFTANLPPLGFTTYVLQQSSSCDKVSPETKPKGDIVLENEYLKVTFSESTGKLSSIYNKETGQTVQISQDFLWYNGSTGNNAITTQASGAYIFRPNISTPYPVLKGKPSITFINGNIVQEVRQIWNSSWVTQVVRLYAGSKYIEFESNIGPVPIDDGNGKEVITRFSTSLNTNKLWWTDSEGQEMQQRQLNFRPTWNYVVNESVACNYYPMNTASFIRDQSLSSQLTILTDRSRGVSSLAPGQLEHMLHRRLLVDDGRGVGEPLNETESIRTSELVFFSSISNSSFLQRTYTILHNNPPIISFSKTENGALWLSEHNVNFSTIKNELPLNVHLLTLKTLDDGQVLLRLNHIYAANEDTTYSRPATVDLSNFFVNFDIISMSEMTLSANRPKSQLHRLKWNTKDNNQKVYEVKENFMVTLNPMEIKTYMIRLQPK